MSMRIGGPVAAPSTQSARGASSAPLTPEQAQQLTQGLLDKDMETRKKSLGGSFSSSYKKKMEQDLSKFLQDNPKATREDVEAFFKKQSSKQGASVFVDKLQFDMFIKMMEERLAELQARGY